MSKSKCITAIIALFTSPGNPLGMSMTFQNEDQILSHFKCEGFDQLLARFSNIRKGKSRDSFKIKCEKLNLDLTLLTQSLIRLLVEKEITSDDARALGEMLGNQVAEGCLPFMTTFVDEVTSSSAALHFLSKVNFKHLESDADCYDYDTPPSLNLSEYNFADNFIEHLEKENILELLNNRESDAFIKYASIIYQRAIDLEIYEFKAVDIKIFRAAKINLLALSGSYGDDSDLVCNAVSAIAIILDQEVVSPEDVVLYLNGSLEYYEALEFFPRLQLNSQFKACAMLEAIQGIRGADFNRAYPNIFSSNSQDDVSYDIIGKLELYPEEKRTGIFLSYICNQLNISKNNASSLLIELNRYAATHPNSESEIVKSLQDTLLVLSGKENLKKVFFNEFLLGFLLSNHVLPNFTPINFVRVSSDDWWDHGSKKLPNSFKVASLDCMSSYADKPEFRKYLKLLSSCYKMEFYKLIAGESLKIAKACKTSWDLGEIKTILVQALNAMSDEEIAGMDSRNKLAAFYISSVVDQNLGLRILSHLELSNSICLDEFLNNLSFDFNFKEIIKANYMMFSKVLTISFNPNDVGIYNLISDVIGRVKRDIPRTTLEISYCISQSISAGVIEKSVKTTEIPDSSGIVSDEGFDLLSYNYRGVRKSFSGYYFGHLKTSLASDKTTVLYDYLFAKNPRMVEIRESSCFIKYDNILYVIGEFTWFSVIKTLTKMKTSNVVFITVDLDNDTSKVTETSLTLNQASLVILMSHFDAISFTANEVESLMTGGASDHLGFRNVSSRLLPEINHMGLKLNKKR